MMVTRQSNGRNRTRIPTESRAHHGIAGGSFGSIRAGCSGTSFISVISLGLMTILSIGLQAPLARRRNLTALKKGYKSRGYIQVQFAKRKGATVLPFQIGR